ncbi:MAG: DUF6765 family protein [Pseudomonadota bacterium]
MTTLIVRKAGFGEDEARIIAYSSQFVDSNLRFISTSREGGTP